jgi:cation diffusion facilitator CzcD-associated flavoprotein CzcO
MPYQDVNQGQVPHQHVVIVGAGFSGIGAAIRLKQAGFHDFVLLERADEVGGCWRDNTYPGCACDVESHLYSFSFAPNPGWTRLYSPQAEILAYLRRVARDHGVLPHVRFGHELRSAAWDERARRWRIETSRGPVTADVLIAGMGPLTEPAIPELPGLARFQGKTFHSARWDHAYPLEGKRVAVVGTGASAIQFVPQIQPRVAKLSLFQRTPAWVLPRLDRAVTERVRRLFARLPAAQKLARSAIYARREAYLPLFKNPLVMKAAQQLAARHLAREVRDAALREKLTPHFRMGCKRVLISDDYLASLTRANVDIVTDGIREVRERSIVTADGAEHEVDAIIFGTGFQVTEVPFAGKVKGRGGRTLREAWHGSPEAHLGTTVAGFPNLFLLLGPNTGLGHSSVVFMMECQLELVMGALEHMRRGRVASLEPRAEAQARWVAEVAARSAHTVWTEGGCKSWYIDATGRNSAIWPGFTFAYRRRARFRADEYLLTPSRAATSVTPVLLERKQAVS